MKIEQLKEANYPTFRTGRRTTFTYSRALEKSPYMGSTFQQDIEPAGEYMIYEDPAWGNKEYHIKMGSRQHREFGTITFKNPLVLEFSKSGRYDETSWKARLSEMYEGATGKELSRAVMKDGHDGIITVRPEDSNEPSEIVNLNGMKVIDED